MSLVETDLCHYLFQIYSLNDADLIVSETSHICSVFIGVAILAGIIYFTAVSCIGGLPVPIYTQSHDFPFQFFFLGIAGERLTKRLRYNTFKAILRQDIGWFDLKTNSTGILSNRLAVDTADIKGVCWYNVMKFLSVYFTL